MSTPLREVPPVHRFTTDPLVSRYDALLGHGTVRACVQTLLDEVRDSIKHGDVHGTFEDLRSTLLERLAGAQTAGLVRVINGTGVLLHTNFGRAPLAASAMAAAAELGTGYTNL